ncbi:hypothetical protein M9H77_30776 [Catharanthus roseus]|uniref:Uncharacterized protein n=1 Tax=Catharanthus roseus TaxID=4058 RepID=A0ACB9ZYJ3_CATRO|nr:hypothetical protein M9H77_30776 [Catharanthus roseus]
MSYKELQDKYRLLYTKWVRLVELHQDLKDNLKRILEQKDVLERRNYELMAQVKDAIDRANVVEGFYSLSSSSPVQHHNLYAAFNIGNMCRSFIYGREQPIRPRRLLALGLDDRILSLSLGNDMIHFPRVLKYDNVVCYSGHSSDQADNFSFNWTLKVWGTEFTPAEAYPVHHFINEFTFIHVMPSLPVEISISLSIKDMDEGIEEGSEEEHNVEEKESSGLDLEARASPPSPAPLMAQNALNKHFCNKTIELRMVELFGKPIMVEKRVSQDMLEKYKVMELLLGMGYVELALFAKKYNENLVKEVYANLSEDFGNTESQAYGQVYVRGHIIDFSPANIAHYLSCPHFSYIEGQLPTSNVTAISKERAHLLYDFATRKRINLCTIIFRNILRQIDQKKASKFALPSPCLISEYILAYLDAGRAINGAGLTRTRTRTRTRAHIYTTIWVWTGYGDAQTRIPVDPWRMLNVHREVWPSGKKIEKYHTGTSIPIPYPGPWRVGSGSKILYPGGCGSESGSKFNYKVRELDPLVTLKIVAPGIVPPSPTLSTPDTLPQEGLQGDCSFWWENWTHMERLEDHAIEDDYDPNLTIRESQTETGLSSGISMQVWRAVAIHIGFMGVPGDHFGPLRTVLLTGLAKDFHIMRPRTHSPFRWRIIRWLDNYKANAYTLNKDGVSRGNLGSYAARGAIRSTAKQFHTGFATALG